MKDIPAGLLEEVVKKNTDDYTSFYNLGCVYAQENNFDKAQENYQKAMLTVDMFLVLQE